MRCIHIFALFAVILLSGCSHSNDSTQQIHRNINVILDPSNASIHVTDSIVFPEETEDTTFILNKNFEVSANGAKIKALYFNESEVFRHYRLTQISPGSKVQLSYRGKLPTTITRSKNIMPKVIFDPGFFYLDGSSAWYPRFKEFPYFSFSLNVEKPDGWEIISQGKRTAKNNATHFEITKPQDDIYLLGGKYQRYSKDLQLSHRDIQIEVYLFESAPELAQKYLDKSAEYITEFSNIIGSYPYSKFAVVENSYQTGYGMPGFTLLGSRIIRFPFILNSSLPHEILHNWWGNGVYVNYQTGNWSEGLTAYMADHFYQKKIGKDVEYRRKALERYANFAANQADFPLVEFTSRHNESSQAVGYSKSMMIFHSLREQIGPQRFDENIKKFWEKFKFKPASFDDVISTLASGSEIDTKQFMHQWLNREGAPGIEVDAISVERQGSVYQLKLDLIQTQPGRAFTFQLPIHIKTLSSEDPVIQSVVMDEKKLPLTFKLDELPATVSVDPDFNTFRLLSPKERPASLGRLFGAEQQYIVIPSKADESMVAAWEALAKQWNRLYNNVAIVKDHEINDLPDDAPVWLVGWENDFLQKSAEHFSSSVYRLSVTQNSLNVDDDLFLSDQHGLVVLDINNSKPPLGFIAANNVETINQLARKLPHYKSYGLLVFDGMSHKNILKMHLPVINSPLKINLN
jgi:hypothetical protein